MKTNLKLTRRDALRFLGGGVVGVMFTPLPWRILDDVTLRTQSGPSVVKLPRGPVTTRFAHCSLCPAGCGLRVRCVRGQPVGLAGVAGHPRSAGKLCPLGWAAHHLPFHPRRLAAPRLRVAAAPDAPAIDISVSEAKARAALWLEAARVAGGRVALLDGRPGRVVSRTYRRWLAGADGLYITPPGSTRFAALDTMLHEPWGSVGVDLARTRTLLAFGAPPGEMQIAPGRWCARRAADPELRVVCVGPRRPRALGPHDLWLGVRPGTEAALALGVAHVLLADHLVDERIARSAVDFDAYATLVGAQSPQSVASLCGVPESAIRDLAHLLALGSPAVVLSGTDAGAGPFARAEEAAILGLDLLLGSMGREGGLLRRAERPGPEAVAPLAPVNDLASVEDGTLRFLIVDASAGVALPWEAIRRKLEPGAHVVCLTPYATGLAQAADLVLPTPAPFESWTESPGTWDMPVESYAVVPPLVASHGECVEPVELVQHLAGWPVQPVEALLRAEVEAIAASKRGTIFLPADASTSSVAACAGALWDRLAEGACWIDAPAAQSRPADFSLLGRSLSGHESPHALALCVRLDHQARSAADLSLAPFAAQGAAFGGVLPPVHAKLHRESTLAPMGGQVLLHPRTAAEQGLRDGCRALLATRAGRVVVRVQFDATVPRGVVLAVVGPDPQDFGDSGRDRGAAILRICAIDDELVWRATPARIREA